MVKLDIIVTIQGNIEVLRIAYVIYHKKVANTEKNLTFTVQIEKEVTRIGENGEEIRKIYILHATIY